MSGLKTDSNRNSNDIDMDRLEELHKSMNRAHRRLVYMVIVLATMFTCIIFTVAILSTMSKPYG